MKKLFLVILIVSVSSSCAQFLNGYGVKIGGTLSKQTWEYSILGGFEFVKDNKIGFNIGAFAELFESPFISFIGEVNYIQKGFQEEVMTSSISDNPLGYTEKSFTRKVRFDYINISLLAKPKIKLGLFTPYLLVGPRIDFEIGKSSDYPLEEFFHDFKKSMIGLKFGIGSELYLDKNKFIAEVLYDLNFSEIYKNPNLEVKAHSLDFRIGMYF
jgi:hypothetical protein